MTESHKNLTKGERGYRIDMSSWATAPFGYGAPKAEERGQLGLTWLRRFSVLLQLRERDGLRTLDW